MSSNALDLEWEGHSTVGESNSGSSDVEKRVKVVVTDVTGRTRLHDDA